jgi:hypothetical protein
MPRSELNFAPPPVRQQAVAAHEPVHFRFVLFVSGEERKRIRRLDDHRCAGWRRQRDGERRRNVRKIDAIGAGIIGRRGTGECHAHAGDRQHHARQRNIAVVGHAVAVGVAADEAVDVPGLGRARLSEERSEHDCNDFQTFLHTHLSARSIDSREHELLFRNVNKKTRCR